MKKIVIIFIFYLGRLSAQEIVMPNCGDGTKLAAQNASHGIYKIYSYGLRIIEDLQFDDYYDDYLWKTYKVSVDDIGCVIGDYEKCYTDKMYDLIEKKFGADFFERARKEALTLYADEIKNKRDSNVVYNYVDSFPEFVGGMDSLNTFLKRNLKYPETLDSLDGKVYISFVVNQQGGLENLEILKSIGEPYSEVVRNVMAISPKWKPGIYFGRKVKVKMCLPISFKRK